MRALEKKCDCQCVKELVNRVEGLKKKGKGKKKREREVERERGREGRERENAGAS